MIYAIGVVGVLVLSSWYPTFAMIVASFLILTYVIAALGLYSIESNGEDLEVNLTYIDIIASSFVHGILMYIITSHGYVNLSYALGCSLALFFITIIHRVK